MIYEFMRAVAGPYLNSAVDCYIAHQGVLNVIVVAFAAVWLLYSIKFKELKKNNN